MEHNQPPDEEVQQGLQVLLHMLDDMPAAELSVEEMSIQELSSQELSSQEVSETSLHDASVVTRDTEHLMQDNEEVKVEDVIATEVMEENILGSDVLLEVHSTSDCENQNQVFQMDCSDDFDDDDLKKVTSDQEVIEKNRPKPSVVKLVSKPASRPCGTVPQRAAVLPQQPQRQPTTHPTSIILKSIEQCIPTDTDDAPMLTCKLKYALEYLQLQKNKTTNLSRRFKEYTTRKEKEKRENAHRLQAGRVYRAVFMDPTPNQAQDQ